MKFIVTSTASNNHESYEKPADQEFSTLEELLAWVRQQGEVILNRRRDGTWELEIYNDYR